MLTDTSGKQPIEILLSYLETVCPQNGYLFCSCMAILCPVDLFEIMCNEIASCDKTIITNNKVYDKNMIGLQYYGVNIIIYTKNLKTPNFYFVHN